MIFRTIIIISFLFISFCYCQQLDSLYKDDKLGYLIETSLENNYMDENIKELLANPININEADKDDLLKLPLIDDKIANEIIKIRIDKGKISKSDLKQILNDKQLYIILLPLINFEPVTKKYSLKLQTGISSEIQDRKGFDSIFLGNKVKSSSKLQLKMQPYNITLGFSSDKDAGESKLNDHYNIFLKYEDLKTKIILGDYKTDFACNLNFSNQSFLFLSDNYYSFTNSKNSIRPYNGTDENSFLRGIAFEYNTIIKTTFFYSNKNIDANCNKENFITSLYTSGLHRYPTELMKKDVLNEKIFGGKIDYIIENHNLAFIAYQAKYDKEFLSSSYYGLKGNYFTSKGLNYNYYSKYLKVSSELSLDRSNNLAIVLNTKYIISDNYIIFGNIRNYPKNYSNPFSYSISSNGVNQNETGFLFGVKAIPFENFTIDTYHDIYTLPYRTYYNPLPSKGSENMVKLSVDINKNLSISLRYREKNTSTNITITNSLLNEEKVITEKQKQEIRLEFFTTLLETIIFKTRVEYSHIKLKINSYSENGFAILHDILYKPYNNLNLNCRFIYFNTDTYETAIYEFEKDIIGIYSVNALYDKGFRSYMFIDFSFNTFKILLKYSNTTFINKNKIGSSYDEISGNTLSRFSLELNFNL